MENYDLLDECIFSILSENYFFHDFYVEKINFSLLGNKFRLVLSNENKVFSIVMKRIFSFTFNIEPLVEEEYYNILSWNNVFKFLRFRHLLDIDFKESKWNTLSVKYINKKTLNVKFDFDCGFNLEIDCIDIKIENLSAHALMPNTKIS